MKRTWIAVLAFLVVGVMGVSFGMAQNEAKVKSCRMVGGTPVTSFGFVIDCDRPFP